ncbi:FTR1 family protein [Propionimicrobium sp. PCR01-08-3]|uniref:FTR1 family iron permease n=1 Tax=Propionimicrobium sp. PCR01-08-3 TaxID=3052086 RepID=UPI00255C74C5|nr:FTR1 family protein [Propionimicrobium sp. PCR01-08-3]WIY82716.1 FTR1 family protein [Propionimicrobium sp. PCR01-08-3]
MMSAPAQADEKDWTSVGEQMIAVIEQIPDQYANADQEGVEQSIRQAYYEIYQVSGLEAQINHRLGDERADAFVTQLLSIRDLTRDAAAQADVDQAVADTAQLLRDDITELIATPELNDQWTRVGERVVAKLDEAKQAYQSGDHDAAANAAKDAYLAHYEADGLEKATISYLGQARVSELESMFGQLRQSAKDGSVSVDEYNQKADDLASKITEDATKLDQLTSTAELGWSGFVASFLVLLREGAEALLVVAAVMTYAMKAGRKDQRFGIIVGVVAALAVSIALAFLFSKLTSSAATGQGQELLEGITGVLAVAMLIWVSNWILSKSSGKKWDEYIARTAGKGTATGGVFALASVAFLAVLREGAETILFFSPIMAGAKTGADHAKIWMGVGAAVVLLAVLFTLVWVFGVRLPMKQFFKWTSILLGILAVTIAGGAVKEFQDAALVSAHGLDGVPQVTVLGLYPTVETLLTQLIIIAILVTLGVLQYRKAKSERQQAVTNAAPAQAEK